MICERCHKKRGCFNDDQHETHYEGCALCGEFGRCLDCRPVARSERTWTKQELRMMYLNTPRIEYPRTEGK